MAFKYNPLSGQIEDQQQGPQGPAGTMTSSAGGTEGTPGFNFDGDTDTGFYSAGADTIGLSTGGTGRLFITSAGTFGFNTSTVREIGHIHNTSSDEAYLRFTNTTTGTGAGDGFNIGITPIEAALIWNKENTDMYFGTNGLNRLVIKNDGKVGIGTTTPSRELTVHSSDSGSTYINLTNSSTTTDSNRGFGIGLSGDEEAKIWNYEDTNMEFGTDGTTRLTITNDGKIGIGTDDPYVDKVTIKNNKAAGQNNWPLHLLNQTHASDARVGIAFQSQGATNNTSSTWDGSGIYGANDGATGACHTVFGRIVDTTFTEAMRIKADGYVGIGTTSPNSPLVIKGPSNGQFEFQLDNENSVNKILSINRVANVYREFHYDGASHDFEIQGTSKLEITSTGNVLVKDGNVGIGNDSPYSNASFNSLTIGKTKKGLIELKDENNVAKAHLYENNGDFNVSTVGSAGSIKLITGDTATRLTIDDDGDIGVSTSTITKQYGRQIQIHDDGIGSPYGSAIHLTNSISGTSGTDGYHTVFQNNHLYHWLRESGDQIFATAGTQKMVIKSDGKVGIGEPTPTAKLELKDSAATVLKLNSTSSDGTALRIQNSGTDKMFLGLAGEFIAGQGSNVTDSAIRASGAFLISTGGGNERMRIDSSGNVGIGTITPNDDLEISSSVPTIRLTDSDGGPCYHQIKGPGNGDLRISCDVGNSSNSNSEIQFDIHDSTKMVIKSDGKVGIGTTNPQAELHVTDATPVFRIEDSTHGFYSELSVEDSGSLVLNADAGNGAANSKVIIKTDGTERASFDVNGAATFQGDINIGAEKYLKFGGTALQIRRASGNNYINSGSGSLYIQSGGTSVVEIKKVNNDPILEVIGAGHPQLNLKTTSTTDNCSINFGDNDDHDIGEIRYQHTAEQMHFDVGSTPNSLIIESNGNATFAGEVKILTGNIKLGTSNGISFSNYTGNNSTGNEVTSNVLNDYEEGTWVAQCANGVTLHDGDNLCSYTKIGRQVTVNGQVRVNNDNSNAVFKITSLPFNSEDLAEGAARCVGSVRLNGIDVTNSTEFIGVNCNNSDGSDDLFFTLNQDNAGTADLLAKADGYVMFTLTYFTT